jgi:hypothetical protein
MMLGDMCLVQCLSDTMCIVHVLISFTCCFSRLAVVCEKSLCTSCKISSELVKKIVSIGLMNIHRHMCSQKAKNTLF